MNKKITVVVLLIVALCAVLTPVLAQEPIKISAIIYSGKKAKLVDEILRMLSV